MVEPAVVNISDVYGDVVKVPASELRVGDFVHDAFGGRIELVKVRHYKHTTTTVRRDGWPDSWQSDRAITIYRPMGE